MVCVYVLFACGMVASGEITVAQLLARMQSMRMASASWNSMYMECLYIQSSLPSLEQLVRHLNLPTDLTRHLQLNRAWRRVNREKRETAKLTNGMCDSKVRYEDSPGTFFLADRINIELSDVEFSYTDFAPIEDVRQSLMPKSYSVAGVSSHTTTPSRKSIVRQTEYLGKWTASISQGTMVAVVGHHGEGKSTLLKIIGGVLLPSRGTYFMPPHLRTFFVTNNPIFTEASLYENLIYGTWGSSNQEDSSLQRVLAICRKVNVPEHVLNLVADGKTMSHGVELSLSERTQLNIVRAFVANPEVLVIEKPTDAFSDLQANKMLQAFKEYVTESGLDLDKGSRRPRTLIFTACRMNGVKTADLVIHVAKDGCRAIAKADVKHDMLN
eukprot:TRINITY_DN66583_c0_g1_i1.p1 TRINITY_DN66583_c0_g1~~TRINITY_DN66583_c0_g1_i1.p1  ORF type:complete len:383 (+),score=47.54 TRINITY_DN66583_c0_g1_i1:1-1149(+)